MSHKDPIRQRIVRRMTRELFGATHRSGFVGAVSDRLASPLVRRASDIRTIVINTPCPRFAEAATYGDYFFAKALADGFERLGVQAQVRCLDAWYDVPAGQATVTIRGVHNYVPPKNQPALLWVISHPQHVTEEECAQFDHVFCASELVRSRLEPWAPERTSTLWQCTDAHKFRPHDPDPGRHHHTLFVGNARKGTRTTVMQALAEGLEVSIFGSAWEDYAPASIVKGTFLKNSDLPLYYSSCDFLLNDHEIKMRENGILSNRVFDGLACGAIVITDELPGAPSEVTDRMGVLSEGVQVSDCITKMKDTYEFSRQRRLEFAEYIREKYNFDARAQTMLSHLRDL